MAPTVDAEGRPGVCLHGPGLRLRVVQTRRPLRSKVATENAVAWPSRRARRGAGRPGAAPGSAGPGGLSVSLLGSWSWPRRRSSAPPRPPATRTRASLLPRAGPVPVSRRGRCPAGRSLPRAPAVCPRVPGPVGVSTELLLLRSSISPRPQLLRRCRRPSHGDTSPPAARRAGGFATCGGAGGRQLFTPPPPPRRSGLTAAGAREPGPSGAAVRP